MGSCKVIFIYLYLYFILQRATLIGASHKTKKLLKILDMPKIKFVAEKSLASVF
jgi:hypothetical protein